MEKNKHKKFHFVYVYDNDMYTYTSPPCESLESALDCLVSSLIEEYDISYIKDALYDVAVSDSEIKTEIIAKNTKKCLTALVKEKLSRNIASAKIKEMLKEIFESNEFISNPELVKKEIIKMINIEMYKGK